MTKTGSFKLKKKINDRGYFAEITLEVSLEDGSGLVIKKECDCDIYQQAIDFGIQYFYECYSRKENSHQLLIKVVDFHWMPVDTRFVVASFVTVKALSRILQFEIEGFSIDIISNIITK